MKNATTSLSRPTLCGLVLALAAAVLSSSVATAHPYATCLTNSAGVVSFRLNEAADSVKIQWNSGASSYTIGALPAGLTVTNLTLVPITVTSPFQVVVDKVGSGSPTLISDNNNVNNQFYGPRAVGVNKRPASAYFGRIYVGNAPGTTASGRPTGDGIYVLNADSSDPLGQGNTVLTAGLDMATGGSSMPWRVRVGQDDDMLYICDYSDATGNLFRCDPNVSGSSGVPIFMAPIGTMASPLDPSMNHGSLEEVYVTGSLATSDLTVYGVDEDYETNPGYMTEINSLWQYNIGAGTLPWSTYPNAKVATPSINFVGQVMGLDRGTNGYWYLLDSRSDGIQNCMQVIDPAGPTVLWESLAASTALGLPRDWLSNSCSVAVSPDMKYCAVQRNGGQVVLMRMANGIPDLAGRIEFTAIGTARQTVFDAADNLYTISASTERMRVYSLGLTTTAITTSDATGSGGAGGNFSLITPSTEVNVTVDTPVVYEEGATTATFTITRANAPSLTSPLTVTFAMSGTATRTSDYVLKTNGVVFTGNVVSIPATQTSLTVTLTAVDDTVAELTESAILTINAAPSYSSGLPPSAEVDIVDNEKSTIDVTVVNPSMYERLTNDYATYRLTRRGDTNAAAFSVNVSFGGGTAAASRYTVPANPVATFNPGDVTMDFNINPVNDNLLQGDQTIVCTVAAAGASEYNIGTTTPSGTVTIVDDEVPAETAVLYSENFNTDVPAKWAVKFGSGNGIDDYRIGAIGTPTFSYDYSTGMYIPAIPPAPHSAADTLGLYLTVNKDEPTALGGAGLNVYPVGQSFSNNYAVRFDMYLMVGNAASTTEYALFGICTSGTKTNWFRNSAAMPGTPTFDGLWFGVEADGAALGDYVIYSGPTTALNNPTALTPGVNASTLTSIFKHPPYGPTLNLAGAPGCDENSATPSWSDVEICKIGRYIRLKINNTFIMSYTNATANTNGNIMLGYCDAYDSIMAGNSCVVYDNLRVVRLDLPITSLKTVGANAEATFTWGVDEATTAFKLQSCATVNGTYADDAGATITKLSPGVYKATVATVAAGKFFRVRYATP
jgi:hypothetical protein